MTGGAADNSSPIILFDGECGFCQRSVRFVLRHDKRGVFRFAARQSGAGLRLLAEHGLPPEGVDSMVLLEDDREYTHSTGSLRIVRRLRFPWWLGYAGIVVPRPLRDAAYKLVARNRHRLPMSCSRDDAIPPNRLIAE